MGTFGRRRIPRRGTESSREWRGESRWLKLVTSWEDVVEELPAVIRAEPLAVETTNRRERASLVEQGRSPAEKTFWKVMR